MGFHAEGYAAFFISSTHDPHLSNIPPRVLATVLRAAQEQALVRVLSGEAELVCTRCGVVQSGPAAVLRRGRRACRIQTSSGAVGFALRQVTCPDCRCTWCPFAEALGLAPYQRVLEELERRLVSAVLDLS